MNARLARVIERLRGFQPSPRAKRLAAWIGYPLFGLAVAVVTLVVTVPRDRIRDRLETALSADVGNPAEPLGLGMDVTIGELSVSLLSGFGFNADNIVLRSRPLNPQEKPTRYLVDDVHLRMGLIGLLTNHPSYHFKGHALSGTAAGRIDNSVDESHANITIEKMSLASVPGLPLPLDGTLGGKLDIDIPKNLMANANGTIELELDAAAVGDGKAKLTVPNDPFLSQGVTIPRVRLGKLSGAVIIEKGRARFENVRAHSADADATLEGYVELHDPLPTSQVHAYLKFRPAEALTKKEPTIDLLVNALAATARRADGYLGVQITGPLGSAFYLPNKEPPFGVTSRAEPPPAAPPPPPTGAAAPPANEPPSTAAPPSGAPVAGTPSGATVAGAPSGAPPSGAPVAGPPSGAPPPSSAVPPSGAASPSGAPAVPPPPSGAAAPAAHEVPREGEPREPTVREAGPREGGRTPLGERPTRDREEPVPPPSGARRPEVEPQ